MRHKEWLENITTDTLHNVALKAGVTPSTIYRQVNADALTIQNVVRIADAYGVNITRALVDTGHIPHRDALAPLLTEATLDELLAEVRRRSH